MELRPLTSIPKKTENRKQWCSEKCFCICISLIMFTVLILALSWSLSLSLLFGGDGKLIFTHKRSLPSKGPTNVLQQPWISCNVWYQLAKYSVKSVSNHSCVVCMKDAVPIAYTGVPGEVDPLNCTSYALCSNRTHNEKLYLAEYAPGIAEIRRDGKSLWAAKWNYHLCLTHCWLMRGDYRMGTGGKYRREGDRYPWRIECPPLTSRIIPPPPNFKLSRAQNTHIVCYESKPESANELNR